MHVSRTFCRLVNLDASLEKRCYHIKQDAAHQRQYCGIDEDAYYSTIFSREQVTKNSSSKGECVLGKKLEGRISSKTASQCNAKSKSASWRSRLAAAPKKITWVLFNTHTDIEVAVYIVKLTNHKNCASKIEIVWSSTVIAWLTPACHVKLKSLAILKHQDLNNSYHLPAHHKTVLHRALHTWLSLLRIASFSMLQQTCGLRRVIKLHGRRRRRHAFIVEWPVAETGPNLTPQ